MLKDRIYRCKNCGHMQIIKTNHMVGCLDYCGRPGRDANPNEPDDLRAGCSWKPSFGNAENKAGRDRVFEYVSEVPETAE